MKIAIVDDFTDTFGGSTHLERLRHLGEVVLFSTPVRDEDEAIRRCKGAQVVQANRERTGFTRRVLESLPDLKLLSMTGGAFNNIDVEAATELGIPISRTRSSSQRAVAELTFGLLIALYRRIPTGDAAVRRGDWPSLVGPELSGKTLGLVGMGKIGTAVAAVAPAFEMQTIATGITLTPERAQASGARYVSLDELMSTADVVSLHVRLTSRTRGMIGAREIGLMKPSAVLINTARAAITDQQALLTALQERKIAGAALDVYWEEPVPADSPLLKLDNVVLTPHVGWTTTAAQEKMAGWGVDNVESFVRGGKPDLVNPDVWEKRRPL